MKCTQYGLYGQAAFKNARIRAGQARAFFGAAHACCPDKCNVFRETHVYPLPVVGTWEACSE